MAVRHKVSRILCLAAFHEQLCQAVPLPRVQPSSCGPSFTAGALPWSSRGCGDGDFAALCTVSQGIPGTGPWRCGAAADLAKPNAFHAQAANFGLPSEVKPGAWRPNHQSERWQVGTAPGVDPAARTKVSFATPPGPAMWAG